MLTRALRAETLKLKRTIALKMVVLAPLAIVLLTVFIASQAPHSSVRRGSSASDDWRAFARLNYQFWAILMLPLYITLEAALIAGLDHAENQWKALLARPVPRWNIYLAKLLILVAMVSAASALLLTGIWIAGHGMKFLTDDLHFGAPFPFAILARQVAEMTGLMFLPLTFQHWVSLRWRSFSVAVGFGIVAMITAFAMLMGAGPYGGWPQYFPWALPGLVLSRHPGNIEVTLAITGVLGLFIAFVTCLDLARRDVV